MVILKTNITKGDTVLFASKYLLMHDDLGETQTLNVLQLRMATAPSAGG